MDTITHALSGALLARATTYNKIKNNVLSLRARLIAGTLAAAFPDIDFIARFFGIINYLETHRGITHSFVLLPVWALLLSCIFASLSKGRYRWRDFYLVSAGGIAVHILGDVITAYGTMMFAPISDIKFAWPTTFIIDFYFSGIIIAALILAGIFRHKGKQIAITGLSVLVSYIGYQATLHHQAEEIAQSYVNQQNIKQAEIYAMPQPFSPYHWKVIVKSSETYHMSYINLLSDEVYLTTSESGFFERLKSIYLPTNKLQWNTVTQYGINEPQLARQVWFMELMKSIRHFMMFPVVDHVQKIKNKQCVWFKDHRFVLDGVREGPFRFGACKGKNTAWELFRLIDNIPVLMLNSQPIGDTTR